MNSGGNGYLQTRLRLLWTTMPSASRRRTARDRLITCRHLTEHLARARQLRAYVKSEADRAAVDGLITDIEQQRAELSDNVLLARRVREEQDGGKDRALRELRAAVTSLNGTPERADNEIGW